MGKEVLIQCLFSVMDSIRLIFFLFSLQSVKVSKVTLINYFSHFF